MMDFQQFFVSLDLIQFEEITDGTSSLPFDYNNYNLFSVTNCNDLGIQLMNDV